MGTEERVLGQSIDDLLVNLMQATADGQPRSCRDLELALHEPAVLHKPPSEERTRGDVAEEPIGIFQRGVEVYARLLDKVFSRRRPRWEVVVPPPRCEQHESIGQSGLLLLIWWQV